MFAEWVVQEQLSWVVKAQGHSWGCSQTYSHPKAWQGPEDPLPWWFPYTAPCWCWLLRGGLNSSLCRLLHKEAWMSSWDGSWLLPGGASDEVEGEEQRKASRERWGGGERERTERKSQCLLWPSLRSYMPSFVVFCSLEASLHLAYTEEEGYWKEL